MCRLCITHDLADHCHATSNTGRTLSGVPCFDHIWQQSHFLEQVRHPHGLVIVRPDHWKCPKKAQNILIGHLLEEPVKLD